MKVKSGDKPNTCRMGWGKIEKEKGESDDVRRGKRKGESFEIPDKRHGKKQSFLESKTAGKNEHPASKGKRS